MANAVCYANCYSLLLDESAGRLEAMGRFIICSYQTFIWTKETL